MRTRRFLAAIGAPLLVVACATGTAPVISSGSGDGGSTSDASSYGADETSTDSGSNKDSGVTRIDSGGGGGGGDSGGGGGGGGDCDNSGGGSIVYDFECEFSSGGDGPCTPGGTDCDSLGDCCFNDPTSSCFSDFGPTCVPP